MNSRIGRISLRALMACLLLPAAALASPVFRHVVSQATNAHAAAAAHHQASIHPRSTPVNGHPNTAHPGAAGGEWGSIPSDPPERLTQYRASRTHRSDPRQIAVQKIAETEPMPGAVSAIPSGNSNLLHASFQPIIRNRGPSLA